MRIEQAKLSPKYFNNSPDPAASLQSVCHGIPKSVLVDDQSLTNKINPLVEVVMDANTGIVFIAKDSATLIRGFKFLGNSPKTQGKREFYLRERSNQNLAAMYIEWGSGITRNSSPILAGLTTVGHNLNQSRLAAQWKVKKFFAGNYHVPTLDGMDFKQSVSKNMQAAGRDGMLRQRGVALYVCPTVNMPSNLTWGRTHRQIGDILTMPILANVATRLVNG